MLALACLTACARGYDSSYPVDVAQPAYTTTHPRVMFDQSHNNHHKLGTTYHPFAKLLENDGYDVVKWSGALPPAGQTPDVLAIVTAAGTDDANLTPAFTEAECNAIEAWVRDGGSLLVVTDHYPFGGAVANLTRRFGVESTNGMTFDDAHHEGKDDSQLVFSRQNGLLADHPITRGMRMVMTFTGASVRGGTPLLKLAGTAVNRTGKPNVIRDGGDVKVQVEFVDPQPALGWSQGVALEHGRGRVVVLAEAAMLSAQKDGDRKIGMNFPGCDNRQFTLNVLHWLSRHS